ncbi:MAG: hypothetical protein Q9220_002717 [cf. Caloplaca sp. 1 TL-2023]
MGDQSQSPFSFGTPATSGPPGGLFGQQNPSSQPQSSLFGSSNQTAKSSGPSLFGGTTTAGGSSLFGGGGGGNTAPGQSSSIFGGGGNASGGGNSLFGGNNQPAPTFNFGQKPSESSSGGGPSPFGQTPSSTAQQPAKPSPFSGFATPNKPADSANAGPSQPTNFFGAGGSNSFQNAASSGQGSAATPTSKPIGAFSFPLGSTTPAGNPPTSQAGGSNPFGLNPNSQQQQSKSLFSMGGSTTSSQPNPSSTAASGGGLFANLGNTQGSSSLQPPPSTGSSNLFGSLNSAQNTGTSSTGPSTSTSMFSKPSQSAAEAQKPSFSFPPITTSQASVEDAPEAPKSAPSLFNLGGPSKSSAPSTTTSSAPPTNLFGNLGKPANSETPAAPSANLFGNIGKAADSGKPANQSASLFGNLGKPADTGTSSAPSVSAPGSSLFGNLGGGQGKSGSADAAISSSQAQPPTTAATSNLFGNLGKATTSSAPSLSQPAAAASNLEVPGNANAPASTILGASTSGQAPSAQSRLKNKSMDEIITRWASDLAKYQKEFQKQAEKVASWDQMLVENSERIQKLYGSTLEAERATAEVERQITAVENDQDELEAWLDRYEKEVDQMISNQGDSFHGPDLERERTYQLAEKLSTRLDEMGKDLGSMIEEINDASSSLNKNAKPDDPLSQVVRVLNSHLTQLQQIDQGTAALQLKVAAAQKASQSFGSTNGYNGPSSDAADSFYRSFMGKR